VSRHINSLNVFVSCTTGKVISVVSVWPEKVSGRPFPSDIEDHERQLGQIGETFKGLPNGSPKLTLADTFGKVMGASQAKQIVAYLVIDAWSTVPQAEPRPVWVVHAWGIPPFMPRGGPPESVPEDARNHLRTEIDAETGESHGSNTIPQPND
jgi:hypothetical protein